MSLFYHRLWHYFPFTDCFLSGSITRGGLSTWMAPGHTGVNCPGLRMLGTSAYLVWGMGLDDSWWKGWFWKTTKIWPPFWKGQTQQAGEFKEGGASESKWMLCEMMLSSNQHFDPTNTLDLLCSKCTWILQLPCAGPGRWFGESCCHSGPEVPRFSFRSHNCT